MTKFLILLLALFMSTFAPQYLLVERQPAGVIENLETLNDLSQIRQTPFYESLVKTRQVITDPLLDHEIKRLQLDDLFKQADALSSTRTGVALKTLQTINTDMGAKQIEKALDFFYENERMQELFEKAGISLKGDGEAKPKVTRYQIQAWADKAQKIIAKADQKELNHKVSTSLQLLRYVLALEEELFFDLFSKGLDEETSKALMRDTSVYVKQFQALWTLKTVFKEHPNIKEMPKESMVKVVNSINDLGLFYMKIAQSISNNAMMFSEEQKQLLKSFQDDVKPMSAEEVVRVLEDEFGQSIDDIFLEFDPEKPLASGTIAQTYRAKIQTSFGVKDVIVKVQRPGLDKVLQRNSKTNQILMTIGKIAAPENVAPFLDLFAGQITGIEDAFRGELDFQAEAEKLKEMKNYFLLDRQVGIPKVYDNYSGKTVLTMEAIPGVNVDKVLDEVTDQVQNLKIKKKTFSLLLDSFLYQTLVIKEVHADMHPGNILRLENGKLALIDWGQTFKSKGLVTNPVKLFHAVFTGDPDLFANTMLKMGTLKSEADQEAFTQMIRDAFTEFKYKKVSFMELIRKPSLYTTNMELEYSEMLFKTVKSALTDFGYQANPRYVQFLRTILPVVSTLVAMGKEIPKKELIKLMVFKAISFVPSSTLKFLGGKTLNAVRSVKKALTPKPKGGESCEKIMGAFIRPAPI